MYICQRLVGPSKAKRASGAEPHVPSGPIEPDMLSDRWAVGRRSIKYRVITDVRAFFFFRYLGIIESVDRYTYKYLSV